MAGALKNAWKANKTELNRYYLTQRPIAIKALPLTSAHDYGLGNSKDIPCFIHVTVSFGLNIMAPLVLVAFLNRSTYDRCSKKMIDIQTSLGHSHKSLQR